MLFEDLLRLHAGLTFRASALGHIIKHLVQLFPHIGGQLLTRATGPSSFYRGTDEPSTSNAVTERPPLQTTRGGSAAEYIACCGSAEPCGLIGLSWPCVSHLIQAQFAGLKLAQLLPHHLLHLRIGFGIDRRFELVGELFTHRSLSRFGGITIRSPR